MESSPRIVSLANKCSPKSVEELPWLPVEKEDLQVFMQDMFRNVQQPMFLVIGKKGSGKSLLLRQLLLPLYFAQLQQAHPKLQSRTLQEFKATNVMLLSPYRLEQSSLAHSVTNFVHVYSAFPGKKLLLVDDLDFSTSAELGALHKVLEQRSLHSKMCIVGTCRSLDRLSNHVIRHARVFHLPYPQMHERALAFFAEVSGGCLSAQRLEQCWVQAGCNFEGMFDLLDMLFLQSGTDSFAGAAAATDADGDAFLRLARSIRQGDTEAGLFASLEPFIEQGFSVADLVSRLWTHWCACAQEDADDDLPLKLALFIGSDEYSEVDHRQQYRMFARHLSTKSCFST